MSPNIISGKKISVHRVNSEEFYIQWNATCHKIEFKYVLLLIL